MSGGGLSLATAITLSYEGDHKLVTLALWYALGVLLLMAGVAFWIEIHRKKMATTSPGIKAAVYAEGKDGGTGIKGPVRGEYHEHPKVEPEKEPDES